MARTVNQAFEEFMRDSVNLDRDIVAAARASRDNLLDNIADFSGKDGFFRLYRNSNSYFGSFARQTKCRELDDIDLMVEMNMEGATYSQFAPWNNIQIKIDSSIAIQRLCSHSNDTLNSRSVLERFKYRLERRYCYSRSKLFRNGEVVRLNLTSKPWAFDIVPCFRTGVEYDGRSYFLIPNGKGDWQKTDPFLDHQRVTSVNQSRDGRLLELIRLCKKWNNVKHAKTIPSYLLETMLVNFAESTSSLSRNLDFRFSDALAYIAEHIYFAVNDMKGIQGDINSLAFEERYAISQKAQNDRNKARQAWEYEKNGNHRQAINLWREIFGEEFPRYDG